MSKNNDSIGKRAAIKAAETAAAMSVFFVLGTILSGGNPLVGAAAAKAAGLGAEEVMVMMILVIFKLSLMTSGRLR